MIYGDVGLEEDAATGKLFAWADAFVGAGFAGDYGTEVDLSLSLYDSNPWPLHQDAAPPVATVGPGAASANSGVEAELSR